MCNTSLQQRAFNNVVEPFSFSTFQLLRTCNRLLLPNADSHPYYNISREADVNLVTSTENRDASTYNSTLATSTPASSPILDVMETISLAHASCLDENAASSANVNEASDKDAVPAPAFRETKASSLTGEPFFRGVGGTGSQLMSLPGLGALPLAGSALLNHKPPLPSFEYIAPVNHAVNAPDFPLMELNRVGVGVFPAFLHRRARGEKRPIPDEQKDEKYYERRKRNNEAAKKSRDARKIREDRIAFRAALLEQENSILRAQVMALRDELQTLRQLIGSTSAAAIGRGVTQL